MSAIENMEAAQTIARSIGEFGNKLYGQLVTDSSNDNLIMSPLSLTSVLSMILLGAKGNTAVELEKALAVDDEKSKTLLGSGYKNILGSLKSSDGFTLSAANRLYVAEGQHFENNYLMTTKDNFLAEPVLTNFGASEQARQAINAWVEAQTNDKIKDLVKPGMLTPETVMVLVNAIHFKGDWAMKFDPAATTKDDFHVSKDKIVQVDMMHIHDQFGLMFRISELDNADVLEIPYKGDRLSMVLILPDEEKGTLAGVEAKLAGMKDLHGRLQFRRKMKTEVSLPKFKVESDFDLVQTLKTLGLVDMFQPGTADFSGMSGNQKLHVSAVVQKAFVEVNEEGAEAAAATAGMVNLTSMPIKPPVFNCNRPFIFLIRDNLTGLTLFQGRVTDPTK